MTATHAAKSAMRKGARAGTSDCGARRRMDMKVMSAQNATSVAALSRRVACPGSNAGRGAGRRHQSAAGSDLVTALRLPSCRLGSTHANRIIEHFDVEEPVLAKPAKDLGINELPLIPRGVPVERVEPAPTPVRMHRDGAEREE